MPPQLADNDNSHDLRAWLATIPSFAADWPRGIISSARAATTPAAPPAPGLSAGGLSFSPAPLAAAANVMSALTRAKGPKAELVALPVVKDAIETLSAWVLETERKRLRIVG